MQVKVIEKKNDDLKATLSKIEVPELPFDTGDLDSGSSLNTEKIYQKYGSWLGTKPS